MVELSYRDISGNIIDVLRAKRTKTVEIGYNNDERRILLTISINERKFLAYEFDVDDWIRATRDAIKFDELSEEGFARAWEKNQDEE